MPLKTENFRLGRLAGIDIGAQLTVSATPGFSDRLHERPRSVVLAGGRAPRALYDRLATKEYDWGVVHVFFSDERCVPPDHHRLTLTLPALSASKLVVFLISGAEKREPLRRLLAGGDLPAARVAARRVLIIADTAAAPTHGGYREGRAGANVRGSA
jgi:6-phosphogluconolactonase/glucosamine-6-phosphate isomerase/deaminase